MNTNRFSIQSGGEGSLKRRVSKGDATKFFIGILLFLAVTVITVAAVIYISTVISGVATKAGDPGAVLGNTGVQLYAPDTGDAAAVVVQKDKQQLCSQKPGGAFTEARLVRSDLLTLPVASGDSVKIFFPAAGLWFNGNDSAASKTYTTDDQSKASPVKIVAIGSDGKVAQGTIRTQSIVQFQDPNATPPAGGGGDKADPAATFTQLLLGSKQTRGQIVPFIAGDWSGACPPGPTRR